MWMNEIEASNFRFFGKDYSIKDIKDIDEYANYTVMNISIEATLDEIAVNNNAYGENAEDQSYRIFEANIVQLTDNDFSLDKIKTIRIPY